ncbi:HEAT repeat domain-containing protein [Methanocella sp. MCL-LM]|uniref:HEAT repeat domain-containing protein n=1 Tax=Methanocella sp. MCL-LM TaxID=3412035 RepID=UPI003C72F3AF
MAKSLSRADKEQLSAMWDFTLPEAERIKASIKLADSGNSDLASTFVELIRLDRSPAMRRSAVAALGRIAKVSSADMSVVRTLERIMVSDRDPAVRSEAEIALSKILKRCESLSVAGKRGSAGKRSGSGGAGKCSASVEGDKSWVIDSDLVRQSLKGPG